MKKIIITSIVLSSILMSGMAFAETNGATLPKTQTRKNCVLSAIDSRNASIKQAKDVAMTARSTALKTKKDALTDAKALKDKTALKVAIKAANDAYRTAIKEANNNLKVSTKTAKDKFKTDVAVCPKL